MTEELAALEDVLMNPDEDGPRLAYADLMKRTDDIPRARFITAQVRIAHVDRAVVSAAIYRKRREAVRLEREHGRRWASDFLQGADYCRFHRGFVELLALSAERFDLRMEQAFELAPIRHLDILATDARSLARLCENPMLERVRSLSMNSCGLTDRDIDYLAGSPHLSSLRWLSLADNKITHGGIRLLARSFRELNYVNLRGNPHDPRERGAYDNGVLVELSLSQAGKELRDEFNPRWLSTATDSLQDSTPDRFRIPT